MDGSPGQLDPCWTMLEQRVGPVLAWLVEQLGWYAGCSSGKCRQMLTLSAIGQRSIFAAPDVQVSIVDTRHCCCRGRTRCWCCNSGRRDDFAAFRRRHAGRKKDLSPVKNHSDASTVPGSWNLRSRKSGWPRLRRCSSGPGSWAEFAQRYFRKPVDQDRGADDQRPEALLADYRDQNGCTQTRSARPSFPSRPSPSGSSSGRRRPASCCPQCRLK